MFSTSKKTSDWLYYEEHNDFDDPSEPSPQHLANQNFNLNYTDKYHLVHVLKDRYNRKNLKNISKIVR